MNALILFSTAVVGLFAIIGPAIMRRLDNSKQMQLALANEFYQRAQKLIPDENLPHSMADMLVRMSDDLTSARISRRILALWLNGTIGKNANSKEQSSYDQEIASLPEAMRRDFRSATAIGLIAVTYAAPISGWIIRRLLFAPIGLPEHSERASVYAYQATHGAHHCIA